MQAQKRRVYYQLGGASVYHHQLQQYRFRVSESLKIETESQRDTTKCPAIGCPTITQPCSKMGWDDVPYILFCKKKINGKWEGHQWRIQREGYGRGRCQGSTPISKK